MSEQTFPVYVAYPYDGSDLYDLKQTDEDTWHVRNDGMLLGTILRDERGFFKPGSEARHNDFDAAVRLTIRGIIL